VEEEEGEIQRRFGTCFDDPLAESKQMLHPLCTLRLFSSRPEAPPSSNSAEQEGH